jgi:hypothetical protein
LKNSQNVDKNLWLVHLVQLKKLFLKLSAYVELYLKQDWSLLPVPDFKLVARSDLVTGHLNFMVAAVLLTATHSGKNLEFERILELVIPTGLRKDIQLIQDAFMMALEPKTVTNSPRRTSLNTTNVTGLTPKVLFPTNLSMSLNENDYKEAFEFNEIKLQEIKEELVISDNKDKTKVYIEEEEYTVDYAEAEIIDSDIPTEVTTSPTVETSYQNDEINLRNEIKLMEIKLEEMEKVLNCQKESEILKTRNLFEIIEELRNLKERQEYEKIERNSLMAAFDQEKQILDDQIEILRKENYEANEKLLCLTNENEELKQNQENKKDFININLHNLQVMTDELNQSILDNSKLVKALKKARDHILKQDSMIKELKENFEESEKTREEEIKILKESFEFERNEMNRVLIDLGGKIQRTNLLNLQQQQQHQ